MKQRRCKVKTYSIIIIIIIIHCVLICESSGYTCLHQTRWMDAIKPNSTVFTYSLASRELSVCHNCDLSSIRGSYEVSIGPDWLQHHLRMEKNWTCSFFLECSNRHCDRRLRLYLYDWVRNMANRVTVCIQTLIENGKWMGTQQYYWEGVCRNPEGKWISSLLIIIKDLTQFVSLGLYF